MADDEQRKRIEDLCFQSPILGLKVAVQLINSIKTIDNDVIKSNERFLNLCDKGIETIQELTKDDNLSDDELKQATDAIMTILKVANDFEVKDGYSNQIIMAAVRDGFDGAFTALGLIATTISND